jgi:hypothetical protein
MIHCDIIEQFYPSQRRLLALQFQPEHHKGEMILDKNHPSSSVKGSQIYRSFVLGRRRRRARFLCALPKLFCRLQQNHTAHNDDLDFNFATTDVSSALANSNPPLSYPHPHKETVQDNGSPPPFPLSSQAKNSFPESGIQTSASS